MPKDALANPVTLAALGALEVRPMHPYELAKVLFERGVPVNRGSIYDTVEAMTRAGWLRPKPSEREGARPQRTRYAITKDGHGELVRRVDAQVRVPRQEFPEFLGAVGHLDVLGPSGAMDALHERAERLAEMIAAGQARFDQAEDGGGVPRLFVIEAEYSLEMLRAERTWVLALIEDIASERLAWPRPRPTPPGFDGPVAVDIVGRRSKER
jgi:DNA-binding PadR family transcriptional regulator